MDKYSELLGLVTGLKDDFEKFYDKGNGAAGTRIRKGLQDIAAFSKTTRTEVQEIKNKK
jgi:hypothetical protein